MAKSSTAASFRSAHEPHTAGLAQAGLSGAEKVHTIYCSYSCSRCRRVYFNRPFSATAEQLRDPANCFKVRCDSCGTSMKISFADEEMQKLINKMLGPPEAEEC